MRILGWIGAAVTIVLPLSACNGDGGVAGQVDPIEALPRQLTAAEQAVIRNSNAFAFDLLERVHAGEVGPNVFISPLSASMALGMAMNGANGETWTEMRDALRFEGLAEEEINAAFRGLLDLLLDLDRMVTVRIGNSVWSRQGFPFETTFYDRVREAFDAEVSELDFGDPASVDVINGWASEVTNGRIENVLERIGPEHIMFLLNALYFKGTWTRRFESEDTRPERFTRADDSGIEVPMMRLAEGAVLYTQAPDYTAIELPYGGGAYAMVVVLPAEDRRLTDVVASLDAQAWDALIAGLDSVDLEVRMPRFRLEYETLLNEPLQELGMERAFCDADFSRLTPIDGTYIDFVKQNTFVDVNEEGTEAAAVTTIGIGVVSAPAQPLIFAVDRPFLFAIRERLSGTILFTGTIGDPSERTAAPVEMPSGPQC